MEQTIGKRIAENRKKLGLTQDQLAEKLGVTAQAVSKWENDQSCPDITTLPQLADIFGTSVDALLGRDTPIYQAEVVENTEPESQHIPNGHWNFCWDNGRKAGIGFAVFVILVGALMLASVLLEGSLSLWSILWPSALLCFGVFGLFPKFSFFRICCTLLGGYFLVELFLPPQLQLEGGIIWAIIILILGASLLIDTLRKPKKPFFHKGNGNTKSSFVTGDNSFTYSCSFSEKHQPVVLDLLKKGVAECSFGEFIIDLSGVEQVTNDCFLELHCSFGELKVLVPKRFAVKHEASTTFADFSVTGQPDALVQGVIHAEAKCSFAEIIIEYI